MLNAELVVQIVLAMLLLFSAASWGIIVYKHAAAAARARSRPRTFLDVFRKSSRFSEVQAVCASLAASPLVGLFQAGYAELNAQLRARRRAKPGEAAVASNPEEPGGGRPRAAARVDDGDRETRASRVVSRDDGVDHAVHRTVRHGVGHHDVVPGHRAAPDRRASASSRPASPRRSIATAAGLFAAIPAVYFYNDLTSHVKSVRQRDGGLLDGVPDHRGTELHLSHAEARTDAAAAEPRRRPPRPRDARVDVARRDQRRAARRRHARAARDLHGGGADDAAGLPGAAAAVATSRVAIRRARHGHRADHLSQGPARAVGTEMVSSTCSPSASGRRCRAASSRT